MSDNNLNNNKIARNTLFLYIRMILVLFVSLYTARVTLNALGVVDFGINNVVAGFVSMFAFLNTSMSNGIQRFYNYKLGKEGKASITSVYNTALLIQALLAIIIVLLLETIGLWYINNRMIIPVERLDVARWLYQFSVVSLLLVIMQIPFSAAIMAYERMDYYAYVSIIEVVLKLTLALVLPYVESDKLLFFGCFGLGVSFLNFFLYYFYSKTHFKLLRLNYTYHKDLFKDMLSFSGWNVFGTFAYMIKAQGLNVLLNAFFGPVVNAARGVASMIEHAIQGFQSNIVISFRPQTVQAYAEGNMLRVKKLMYSLSKISFILLFMLSLPVIIELPYILKIWLGEAIPDYTIPFTILTLVIMVVSGLNTPLSQVVHATGKMKTYQVGTSIVVCSILPVALFTLKLGYSPNAVYIVCLLMTLINQGVCMLLLKRIFSYKILEYMREVIWPCCIITILSTALTLASHSLLNESFYRLVVVGLIGLLSTSVGSYFLVMNTSEKNLIIGYIYKFIKNK